MKRARGTGALGGSIQTVGFREGAWIYGLHGIQRRAVTIVGVDPLQILFDHRVTGDTTGPERDMNVVDTALKNIEWCS